MRNLVEDWNKVCDRGMEGTDADAQSPRIRELSDKLEDRMTDTPTLKLAPSENALASHRETCMHDNCDIKLLDNVRSLQCRLTKF